MTLVPRTLALLVGGLVAALLAGCTDAGAPPAPAPAAAPSAAADPACAEISGRYASLKGTEIVVGTSPGPSNYDAPDPADPNKIVGVEPDLLDAIGQCVGFTHTVKKFDFGGLIPALQAKQINAVASGMYASDERAQQVSFVQYMKASEAAVVAKGNPKQITSLEALCGVTASETVGTVENAIIDKQNAACTAAGKPAVTILSFQGNQAVDAVAQGRADVFLTDAGVASYLAGQNPALETGFPIPSDFVFGLATAKDDTVLRGAVADTMSAFYRSGRLKEIITRWGFAPEQVYEPSVKG